MIIVRACVLFNAIVLSEGITKTQIEIKLKQIFFRPWLTWTSLFLFNRQFKINSFNTPFCLDRNSNGGYYAFCLVGYTYTGKTNRF